MTHDAMPLRGGRTAQALGIETRGGVFTALIERDTAVPCQRSEIFTTADDDQPQIKITVYRGDSGSVADNQRVGVFEMPVPHPGPRGVPQLEITFAVDHHGWIQVLGRDLTTGQTVPVAVTG